MGETPEKPAPQEEPRRSLNDFAHLFLTRPGETRKEERARGQGPPSKDPPAEEPAGGPPPSPHSSPAATPKPAQPVPLRPLPSLPPDPPRKQAGNPPLVTAAFLDGGEGWIRTFLCAETALYLSREGFSVEIAQEGGLFPTVSGHLGRILGRKTRSAGSLRVFQAGPGARPAGKDHLFFLEVPAHLPRWALDLCGRARLLVLAVPAHPAGRIRAFHQLKRILGALPAVEIGVVAAERPGTGEGRQVYHKFLAAQDDLPQERISFLGALPADSALEKVFLAERKPALVWSPGSLAAAAVGRIGAGILKRLHILEAAP